MAYVLKFHRDVEKQLRRIPRKQQERVVEAMRSLRTEPRPPGSEHLDDILYRIRVGQYRIIYAIFDEEVVIVVCKVARRSEKTYRDLDAILKKAIRTLFK